MTAAPPIPRLPALDALRGLAAVSVVVYHCLLVNPALNDILFGRGVPFMQADVPWLAALLTTTPPSLMWSGREAVLLFFVLSGFVLALPYFDGHRVRYLPFAIKRLIRLLAPCIATALILAAVVPQVAVQPRPDLSHWFNSLWQVPVTPGLVLRHALLLSNDYPLNNVLWTLHHELRVSLAFPLLVAVAMRGTLLALVISGVALVVGYLELRLGSGWLETLIVVPHFMFGILLARHCAPVVRRLAALGLTGRLAVWGLCYTLLTVRWLLPLPGLVCDGFNGIGATLLIAMVLASRRVTAWLSTRPLLALGAISYSLYLVHVPMIVGLIQVMPRDMPVMPLTVAAALASLVLATLLYRLVERPSIAIGRSMAVRSEIALFRVGALTKRHARLR